MLKGQQVTVDKDEDIKLSSHLLFGVQDRFSGLEAS